MPSKSFLLVAVLAVTVSFLTTPVSAARNAYNMFENLVDSHTQHQQQQDPHKDKDGDGIPDDEMPMIVGGDEALIGEFPYFVEMNGCGGALIASDIVLYAAHCGSWKDKQINIGSWERLKATGGSQPRFCDKYKGDPKYGTGGSSVSTNYDFALCKLDKPVDMSDFDVRLVLNDKVAQPRQDNPLIVMGHGYKVQGAWNLEPILRKVTVPYVTTQKCNAQNSYGGYYNDPHVITDQMMCAGLMQGGKDSCQGDSGGPIVKSVVRNNQVVHLHVGVVSWGIGCAQAGYPGVYARTSSRADWIRNTACNFLDSQDHQFCNDNGNTNNNNNNNNNQNQCGANQEAITIKVRTDDKPHQTSLRLEDLETGKQVLKRQYLVQNYENEHELCLPKDSCYELKILDTNGICDSSVHSDCDDAISVWMGDDELKSMSGDLEGSNEGLITFCASDTQPPTMSPTPYPTCASENQEFQIRVQSDQWPEEIIVGLFAFDDAKGDYETSTQMIMYKEGRADFGYETMNVFPFPDKHYCLKLRSCYEFVIRDTWGDGLSSYNGYFELWLGGNKIYENRQNFKKQDRHFFCTNPEICDDSPNVAFQASDKSCTQFLKNGNKNQKIKKCKRRINKALTKNDPNQAHMIGKRVYQVCPETCQRKAGIASKQCQGVWAKQEGR